MSQLTGTTISASNLLANSIVTASGSSTGIGIPRYREVPPKPIFIFGVPSGTPHVEVDKITNKLFERLTDYHVLVIVNAHIGYTAKVYSVSGDFIHDLDDIKNYIKSKL